MNIIKVNKFTTQQYRLLKQFANYTENTKLKQLFTTMKNNIMKPLINLYKSAI